MKEIALRDEERQPCEVWTRVMGYHRPTTSFNIGKLGEHMSRRFFVEHEMAEGAGPGPERVNAQRFSKPCPPPASSPSEKVAVGYGLAPCTS